MIPETSFQSGGPSGSGVALCAFSSDGRSFATTTSDGRIKAFDAVTGALVEELQDTTTGSQQDNHLSAGYTSMIFLKNQGTTATAKKSSKKSSSVTVSSGLLVVGNKSGQVAAWDTSLWSVKWCVTCHDGGVTALAYPASNLDKLYTCGKNAQLCEIEASSGQILRKWKSGKNAPSCLAVSPDATRLLAGSSGLVLWDLSAEVPKTLCKLTGHTVEARAAAFSLCGKAAVSCAPAERHIAVWDCGEADGSKGKKEVKGASLSLSMEHPALQLATGKGRTGLFDVMAVSEAGEAYVWSCGMSEVLATWRVQVVGSSCRPMECVLSAWKSEETNLLVVRGLLVRPTFEHVVLPASSGGKEVQTLELQTSVKDAMHTQADGPASKKRDLASTVTVLGAETPAELIRGRLVAGNKSDLSAANGTAGVEDEAAAATEDVEMEGGGKEVTLGERLARLATAAGEPLGAWSKERAGRTGELPKADSLGSLLSQAVRSNDKELLERCLNVADDTVVNNSVRRLQPNDAVELLELLLLRLQSRPGRGIQLARWFRAVLVNHSGYLMSSPTGPKILSTLCQLLNARTAIFPMLLQLSGRLDLLLAHQQSSQQRDGAPSGMVGPLVDFTEPEVDENGEVEVEDPFAYDEEEDGEEDEWETGDEDDEDDEEEEEMED
ncbi:hypothetical protein CYMTET_13638 [Cymbomonas tetramitiformis]|uniref:Small-subunit processome Utp12 domain-containing protein n=1 Tax=Cymbomonas tetramitiformis TaxID=36881 RepID=A0AAE0GHP4_9CHLO|nr:hypothetical protein CYMTET_13638 [Cymbomonas tetramitiformis]